MPKSDARNFDNFFFKNASPEGDVEVSHVRAPGRVQPVHPEGDAGAQDDERRRAAEASGAYMSTVPYGGGVISQILKWIISHLS